jgi:hypothetical protein
MIFLTIVKFCSCESGLDETSRLLASREASEIPLVKFGSCTKLYAFGETNRQMTLLAGQ